MVKRTSAVNGKGLRALAPVAAAAASSRGLGMQGAAKPTSALELAGLDDVGRSLTVVGRVAEAAAVPGLDALAAQSAQGKGYKGGKGNQWGKGGKGSGPGDNGTGEEQRRAPKGVPTKLLNFNEATGVASVRANDAKFQASRDKATTEAGDDALGGPGSRGPQDYGDALPPALQCPLCKGLVVDAVVLQWCRTSACDGCVRQAMRTNDSVCPITSEKVNAFEVFRGAPLHSINPSLLCCTLPRRAMVLLHFFSVFFPRPDFTNIFLNISPPFSFACGVRVLLSSSGQGLPRQAGAQQAVEAKCHRVR